MLQTRAERKKIAASIPWVTLLSKPERCTGFMNRTSIKHIFGTDEERAKKPTCKNRAYWRFKGKKGDPLGSHDGTYCWSHLISRGLYGSMTEESRTERWLREHYPEMYEKKDV